MCCPPKLTFICGVMAATGGALSWKALLWQHQCYRNQLPWKKWQTQWHDMSMSLIHHQTLPSTGITSNLQEFPKPVGSLKEGMQYEQA